MQQVIVDTSVWIEYFQGNKLEHIDRWLQDGSVYTTGLIVSEVLSGDLKRPQRQAFEKFFSYLPLCPTPLDHWTRVGLLRANVRKKGITISTPDAHIAQSALDEGHYLCSNDQIFQKLATKTDLKMAQSS